MLPRRFFRLHLEKTAGKKKIKKLQYFLSWGGGGERTSKKKSREGSKYWKSFVFTAFQSFHPSHCQGSSGRILVWRSIALRAPAPTRRMRRDGSKPTRHECGVKLMSHDYDSAVLPKLKSKHYSIIQAGGGGMRGYQTKGEPKYDQR